MATHGVTNSTTLLLLQSDLKHLLTRKTKHEIRPCFFAGLQISCLTKEDLDRCDGHLNFGTSIHV